MKIRVRTLDKTLEAAKASNQDVALASLTTALRAWLATSINIPNYYQLLFNDSNKENDDRFTSDHEYRLSFMETIIHFHHFFELTTKDVLRARHELLALNNIDDGSLLDRLSRGEQIPEAVLAKLNTVEFGTALSRLQDLVEDGGLTDPAAKIIDASGAMLRKLNTLRNRVLHRGTVVLFPLALDEFVGAHLLPLAVALASLKPKSKGLWCYTPPTSGGDPFDAIVAEYRKPEVDMRRIVILKEVARAAYHNPLIYRAMSFDERERKAAREAAVAISQREESELETCPVCGEHDLVLYISTDSDSYGDEGEPINPYWCVFRAECMCCTYSPPRSAGQPSDVGLVSYPDVWKGEYL